MSDDDKTTELDAKPKKKKASKPTTVQVTVEAAFDGFRRGDRLELPNDKRTTGLLRNGLVARL